jgi:hypothetical protein
MVAAILAMATGSIPSAGDEPPMDDGPPSPGAIVLRITLGRGDERPSDWSGGLTPSAGSVLAIEAAPGTADVDLPRWTAPSRAKKAGQAQPIPAVLVATLEAHPASEVAVDTAQGQFSFRLDELPYGVGRVFLDGRAAVERVPPAPPLAQADRGPGHFVIVVGPAGGRSCGYVANSPPPSARPQGAVGGRSEPDAWLTRFDGRAWSAPVAVTCTAPGVGGPTIAVDGSRNVWLIW